MSSSRLMVCGAVILSGVLLLAVGRYAGTPPPEDAPGQAPVGRSLRPAIARVRQPPPVASRALPRAERDEPVLDRPPPDASQAAAAAAPADEATAGDGDGSPVDANAAPSRDQLRGALPAFLARHMGGRQLTSGQLEALIDAMTRARDAYQELSGLDDTPANARHIAELRERAARAHADSTAVVGAEPLGLSALWGVPANDAIAGGEP